MSLLCLLFFPKMKSIQGAGACVAVQSLMDEMHFFLQMEMKHYMQANSHLSDFTTTLLDSGQI